MTVKKSSFNKIFKAAFAMLKEVNILDFSIETGRIWILIKINRYPQWQIHFYAKKSIWCRFIAYKKSKIRLIEFEHCKRVAFYVRIKIYTFFMHLKQLSKHFCHSNCNMHSECINRCFMYRKTINSFEFFS